MNNTNQQAQKENCGLDLGGGDAITSLVAKESSEAKQSQLASRTTTTPVKAEDEATISKNKRYLQPMQSGTDIMTLTSTPNKIND